MRLDQLLYEVKDNAPLAIGLLVALIAALGLGYVLMYARTTVVKAGGSDAARALRVLEAAPALGGIAGDKVVHRRAVVRVKAGVPAPITGEPVAGFRVIAVEARKKPREQRLADGKETISVELHRSVGFGSFSLEVDGEPLAVTGADVVFAGPPSAVFKADDADPRFVAWGDAAGVATSRLGVPTDVTARLWALRDGDEVGVVGRLAEVGEGRALAPVGGDAVVVYFGPFEAARDKLEWELP